MNTCWKCRNPLRARGVLFGSLCGACFAGRRDPLPPIGSPASTIPSSRRQGLSFLWLLAFPIALHLPHFSRPRWRRLKWHRPIAPSPHSPWLPPFTQSPEGLKSSGGFKRASASSPPAASCRLYSSYLLLSVMACGLHHTTSRGFPWDDGVEGGL